MSRGPYIPLISGSKYTKTKAATWLHSEPLLRYLEGKHPKEDVLPGKKNCVLSLRCYIFY